MYTFSGLRVDTLNVVENYTTYKVNIISLIYYLPNKLWKRTTIY